MVVVVMFAMPRINVLITTSFRVLQVVAHWEHANVPQLSIG